MKMRGATTFRITTFNRVVVIVTLGINDTLHNVKLSVKFSCYAKCRIFVMLSVNMPIAIRLSVMAPDEDED